MKGDGGIRVLLHLLDILESPFVQGVMPVKYIKRDFLKLVHVSYVLLLVWQLQKLQLPLGFVL